jgi:TnsA endonuclease N terminal
MYQPLTMNRSKKFGSEFWHGKSYKVKRDVNFFSNLEYEHWLLVENDPRIINFCEQPLEIKFFYEGKLRSSIFDMWVKYNNGLEEFREIKYESHLKVEHADYKKTKKQLTIQREWCEMKGFAYSVQTEVLIRENLLYIDNCRMLISHVRMVRPKHVALLQGILDLLIINSHSIKEICDTFQHISSIDVQITIFLGIYLGKIAAPIKDKQITQFMEVSRNV